MADIEQNLREIARAKGLKLSDIAARMGTTVSNLLTSVKVTPPYRRSRTSPERSAWASPTSLPSDRKRRWDSSS